MKVRLDLEYISCCICDIDDTRLIMKAKSLYSYDYFNIVRCKKCGLIYVNPRIKIEQKKENLKMLENVEYFEKSRLRDNLIYQNVLNEIESINKIKGKILDIGCATGGFLLKAKERGWETYGVEINKNCAKFARQKYNLNVFAGELEDAKFPSQYFDVVVMIHVIEHLYNPLTVIIEIYRILKERGLLYIITPNFNNYIVKFAKKLGYLKEVDKIDPTGHPYMFTKYSLKILLARGGFNILNIKDGITLLRCKRKLLSNNFRFLNYPVSLLLTSINKLGGGSSICAVCRKL